MAYNITDFTIVKMENFRIRLRDLYLESIRKDWRPKYPKIEEINEGIFKVRIYLGCEQELVGYLENNSILKIEKMYLTGEGSGTMFREVLTEAFKNSAGTLQAVRIWEGGDSTDKYSVIDGHIVEEDIDLTKLF